MSDAKPFGPYLPNDSMLDLCLNTVQTLWKNKEAVEFGQLDVNGVAYASGFHALCGYCDWNADCLKFHDSEYQPEWQADMQRLADLKDARSALKTEIEELEQSLKNAYALTGAKDWINTGSHRFRVTQQAGRRNLNRDLLLRELQDALGDDRAAEKLISWCKVEGKPCFRLSINPLN